MGTKTITLRAWMTQPLAYETNWLSWRPVAPGGETTQQIQVVTTGPAADFYFWPFPDAVFPQTTVINRDTEFPIPGWTDENFVMRLVNPAPYLSGRSAVFPQLFTGPIPVIFFEQCVNIEIDFPDYYLAQIWGYYDGIKPGAIYCFPGELVNISLAWKSSEGQTIYFRGGVQEYPVVTNGVSPGAGWDHENNPVQVSSYFPIDDIYNLESEVTGRLVKVTSKAKPGADATGAIETLYGIGWMIEPVVASNAWAADVGILNSECIRGISAMTRAGETLEFVLPVPYSQANLRCSYFTTTGKLAVVGHARHDSQGFYSYNHVFQSRTTNILLAEQRTAIAHHGPFIEIGASRPTPAASFGFDSYGATYNGIDPTLAVIQIKSFDTLDNEKSEDITARVIKSTSNIAPFERAQSRMMGSGLALFSNSDDNVFATWWSCNGAVSYARAPIPYLTGRQAGEKWFESQTIPDPTSSPTAGVDPLAMLLNPRFIPNFRVSSYYLWNPKKPFNELFYEPPGSVDLMFSRAPASRTDLGYVENARGIITRLVATLDELPFCHMPILSESEFGGTGLYLTDGQSGCWFSDDQGENWEPWEDWTPAFEKPFFPLDAAMLAPGPACWGFLALEVPDDLTAAPRVWFRITHDAGASYDDPVPLGTLPVDAWVWGCGILSGHRQRESWIAVANSNRLMWVSNDTGSSFEEIAPAPASSGDSQGEDDSAV
jgi:hypothetical protein